MSLDADPPAAPTSARLLVEPDARSARGSWEGLRARVEARGGLAATDDQLDRVIDGLHRRTIATATSTPRHPWRSAWWIVPFAGCLGGEWLVRRRRGEA